MVQTLIYADDTTGTPATIPNTDTTVKTTNIRKNSWQKVLVSCNVSLIQTATSTAQNVTFKIKNGSTTLKSLVIATTANAATLPVNIRYAGPIRTGGAITVTVLGAAADANTSTKYESLWIHSEA